MDALARLCQDALAMPALRSRHNLNEAVEFCDFYRQELVGASKRWRARFTRKPGTQPPSPSARPRRNTLR
jgi:hypothetical protein